MFYKYKYLKDILDRFQEPMKCSIILTHINATNIAIKSYPWNKYSESFFEKKLKIDHVLCSPSARTKETFDIIQSISNFF